MGIRNVDWFESSGKIGPWRPKRSCPATLIVLGRGESKTYIITNYYGSANTINWIYEPPIPYRKVLRRHPGDGIVCLSPERWMANQTKRRSAAITEGPNRAPARAMFKAVGFSDDDLCKPIIGIANTWIEIAPAITTCANSRRT